MASRQSAQSDQQLQSVLTSIMRQINADVIVIYAHTCARDFDRLELVTFRTRNDDPWVSQEATSRWLHRQLVTHTGDCRRGMKRLVPLDKRAGGEMCSALLWVAPISDDSCGTVALFSRAPGQFSDGDFERIQFQVEMAQVLLANRAGRTAGDHRSGCAARAIAADPSPQNVVHILRDHLFDEHVVSCWFGLFGPMQKTIHAGVQHIEISVVSRIWESGRRWNALSCRCTAKRCPALERRKAHLHQCRPIQRATWRDVRAQDDRD
jgi:hypothetical protein